MTAAATANWAIRIRASDLPRLAPFRLDPDIEIWPADCDQTPEEFWLRGKSSESAREMQLRQVPARARYQIAADGLATPLGHRVPETRLPEPTSSRWAPLRDWWRLHPQPAALHGQLPLRVPLKIVRAKAERPTNAILTDTETWQHFASTHPSHRLARLEFAADQSGRVLIVGIPLPPIRGQHYCIEEGIALPAGLAVDPAVAPVSLSKLLALPRGAVALFALDASYQRIDAAQFTKATRSAARLTALNTSTRDL